MLAHLSFLPLFQKGGTTLSRYSPLSRRGGTTGLHIYRFSPFRKGGSKGVFLFPHGLVWQRGCPHVRR